ncbi:MAG: hypothetical protein AABY65_14160 [Nitrospirota bacterium]
MAGLAGIDEVEFDLERDRFTVRYATDKISLRQIEETVLAHGRREGLDYSVTFFPAEILPSNEERG